MDIGPISEVAPFYVAINVNPEIYAATLTWVDSSSTLLLTYYAVPDASDEVENLCDLALAELLSQFFRVEKADISVIREPQSQLVSKLEGLVYLRGVLP